MVVVVLCGWTAHYCFKNHKQNIKIIFKLTTFSCKTWSKSLNYHMIECIVLAGSGCGNDGIRALCCCCCCWNTHLYIKIKRTHSLNTRIFSSFRVCAFSFTAAGFFTQRKSSTKNVYQKKKSTDEKNHFCWWCTTKVRKKKLIHKKNSSTMMGTHFPLNTAAAENF